MKASRLNFLSYNFKSGEACEISTVSITKQVHAYNHQSLNESIDDQSHQPRIPFSGCITAVINPKSSHPSNREPSASCYIIIMASF